VLDKDRKHFYSTQKMKNEKMKRIEKLEDEKMEIPLEMSYLCSLCKPVYLVSTIIDTPTPKEWDSPIEHCLTKFFSFQSIVQSGS
jgi:hypothetical protein